MSPQLNHRVTLQRREVGSDAHGQDSETWVDVGAEIWAGVEPLRGRTLFAAQQAQSEVSMKFIIRWRSDVTAEMRVVWNGTPYRIDTAPPDPRRRWLELMCSNRGANDAR